MRKMSLVKNEVKLSGHLNNRRLILGLTREEAAARLGVLREVYDRWERNELVWHEKVIINNAHAKSKPTTGSGESSKPGFTTRTPFVRMVEPESIHACVTGAIRSRGSPSSATGHRHLELGRHPTMITPTNP